MAFRDDYEFENIKNEAEDVVIDELENELKKSEYDGFCRCEDCILDTVAYALNKIEPLYRSTLTGAYYAKKFHEGEYQKNVLEKIKQAIKVIHDNPSHERK